MNIVRILAAIIIFVSFRKSLSNPMGKPAVTLLIPALAAIPLLSPNATFVALLTHASCFIAHLFNLSTELLPQRPEPGALNLALSWLQIVPGFPLVKHWLLHPLGLQSVTLDEFNAKGALYEFHIRSEEMMLIWTYRWVLLTLIMAIFLCSHRLFSITKQYQESQSTLVQLMRSIESVKEKVNHTRNESFANPAPTSGEGLGKRFEIELADMSKQLNHFVSHKQLHDTIDGYHKRISYLTDVLLLDMTTKTELRATITPVKSLGERHVKSLTDISGQLNQLATSGRFQDTIAKQGKQPDSIKDTISINARDDSKSKASTDSLEAVKNEVEKKMQLLAGKLTDQQSRVELIEQRLNSKLNAKQDSKEAASLNALETLKVESARQLDGLRENLGNSFQQLEETHRELSGSIGHLKKVSSSYAPRELVTEQGKTMNRMGDVAFEKQKRVQSAIADHQGNYLDLKKQRDGFKNTLALLGSSQIPKNDFNNFLERFAVMEQKCDSANAQMAMSKEEIEACKDKIRDYTNKGKVEVRDNRIQSDTIEHLLNKEKVMLKDVGLAVPPPSNQSLSFMGRAEINQAPTLRNETEIGEVGSKCMEKGVVGSGRPSKEENTSSHQAQLAQKIDDMSRSCWATQVRDHSIRKDIVVSPGSRMAEKLAVNCTNDRDRATTDRKDADGDSIAEEGKEIVLANTPAVPPKPMMDKSKWASDTSSRYGEWSGEKG